MATYDLTSSIPNASSLRTGDVLNCPYSGTYKTITLPAGTYQLLCWGALGGSAHSSTHIPGKGGYSSGELTLQISTTLYITVGGLGSSSADGTSVNGGYNGGGTAIGTYNNLNYGNGSGGGASDIRIGQNSLYARIIVAGGGGGSATGNSSLTVYGGAGGGTNGVTASGGSPGVNAGGGSQTSGGVGGYWSSNNKYEQAGSFGQGGSFSASYSASTAGGGGGWYGGGSATWQPGGGGSGYVYTSSTASNYPSGCQLNSSMYLANAQTISGNTSFPSTSGSTETGHKGNGYIRITVISNGEEEDYSDLPGYDITSEMPNKLKTGDILKCPYTGNVISIQLPKGTYKFECWGAQGGGVTYTSYWSGGKGGYAVGILTLTSEKTIYCLTGGKPTTYNTGGFNGGGNCTSGSSSYSNPGGGASDIRINQNSLYARVIVAGGGGGASNGSTGSSYTAIGGCGGGTSGGAGTSTSYSAGALGLGGTQTSGGSYGYWSGYLSGGVSGSFGQGGSPTASNWEAGGGGGWYGGGSGNYCSAGGGSGYVYTSSSAANYPSGCLLDSSMYLTNAQTIAGNTSMPSVPGSTETGHSGNGFIKISVISVNTDTAFYVKISQNITLISKALVKVSDNWKLVRDIYTKVDGNWIKT